ncbi:DNA polymerase II [Neptunicella marina]|uniref:DNA polymerase n=1 Tax=Neptunicella marina TaxID=2125989 RepID=A0A8J6IU08_9ALTE|nr:DNA polymerase II [Neptunicella marina]MBC3767365.1 DNA polymerase II [Neptunicella marina]
MNIVERGFILTRQQIEKHGQTFLEFWLSTDSGPVKVQTPVQEFVFFVAQVELARLTLLFNTHQLVFRSQQLNMTDFQHRTMAAVYLPSQHQLQNAKRLCADNRIRLYEDDIRLADRYLMERFIYGNALFTGVHKEHPSYREVTQAKLQTTDYQPVLAVLSIDLECSANGELFSIGMASETVSCVLMIGEPQAGPDWIEWLPDERTLLLRFADKVNQLDPDILVGWNVVNFDCKLLLERAKMHAIKLNIGRDGSAAWWKTSRAENDQGFIGIAGRVVVDGIDALKTATYQFDSFSLEFVARTLLGKGKSTDDVDNRLARIEHDFIHNKIKLAEYNLQDCLLVLEILAHTNIIDFLQLRSQLTGLELDRMGGSVAAFTNVYLPKLHRAGFISPNRPAGGGLASPGGYVMNSSPGLYQHVLVLDFKSLYPSIIRTFKIDPLGLVQGLASPENAIPGFKGASFDRKQHFLPDIITSLWRQRDEAKRQQDAARSQAIKILMNSFYGVLGSGGCRFYDTRLASSITMRGHEIMQTTASWIREQGYDVIYGDTDSTFVWLKNAGSTEQANRIGQHLQQHINQQWQQKLADEYNLDCHLEIEFETHFKHFLMPTIRGAETGSKKRYAGIKTSEKGDKLVFKGLETVRSDWTALAKEFQTKLYQMVFDGEPVNDYIRSVVEGTRQGRFDHMLVYKKRLRQRLHKYTKNVPPHVKAARMADHNNQQQGKALKYQNKGWVSYVLTINGPEAIEHQSSQLDYEHYIDRQIKPVAEGILPFIGLTFEQLVSNQLDLF